MPGRRGRRLNIVDDNGNVLDRFGNPQQPGNQQQNAQPNIQQQNNLNEAQDDLNENLNINNEINRRNQMQGGGGQQQINNQPDEDEEEPFLFQENFEGVNDRPNQPQPRRNRRLDIRDDGQAQQNGQRQEAPDATRYAGYIDQLKAQDVTDAVAAKLIAAFMTMPAGGVNAPINEEEINKTANKLMKQEAFRLTMKEPKAASLVKQGNGIDLIGLMAEKQEDVDRDNARYKRGSEKAAEDVIFLNDAIKSLSEEDEAGKKPVEIEKENKYFMEMNKHLDHARMLAGIGEPLSGAEAKNLVNATKKYLNGGTQLAGGTKAVAAQRTAMCILSRYMPPEDFRTYCDEMTRNPNRKIKNRINAENYTHGRLMGIEKTPQEMRKEYGETLKKDFSKENVASVVAVSTLLKKKNGGLITVVDIDEEKKQMLKEGSAFNKAWEDPQNREKYKNIAKEGSYALLGREVTRDAQKHSVKAAQGVINRSVRTMVSTPLNQYFATEHISNILAAKALAAKADAGSSITNKEFKDHMEMYRKDPFVLQLGARYANDPVFRNQMNHQLSANSTADPLLNAYNSIKNPPKPHINREAPQNVNNGQQLNPQVAQAMQHIDNIQMPFAGPA